MFIQLRHMIMRWSTRIILPATLLFVLSSFLSFFYLALPTDLYAQAPEGAYDEEEAQAIDQMLMCPVCPAESIDQAQVPLARQMRQRVREMLAEGASRQEVLDYFADRYGQNVLASPPKSGLNLLAWILPIVGLLAALVVALLVLRAMKGRNDGASQEATPPPPVEVEEELEPYLAAVDRSLDINSPDAEDSENV